MNASPTAGDAGAAVAPPLCPAILSVSPTVVIPDPAVVKTASCFRLLACCDMDGWVMCLTIKMYTYSVTVTLMEGIRENNAAPLPVNEPRPATCSR